jgi:hypothetical protein
MGGEGQRQKGLDDLVDLKVEQEANLEVKRRRSSLALSVEKKVARFGRVMSVVAEHAAKGSDVRRVRLGPDLKLRQGRELTTYVLANALPIALSSISRSVAMQSGSMEMKPACQLVQLKKGKEIETRMEEPTPDYLDRWPRGL